VNDTATAPAIDTPVVDWSPLDALLRPLPDGGGGGPPLRYDAVMVQIRQAREEDDSSLPMGEWDRPLKLADWARVNALCTTVLATRSKDLQVAAWWLESAVHLRQADGLVEGMRLLCGLVEGCWDALHPRIDDDGDSDARVAPFAWLNENLPLLMRLHLALLPLPGRKPPRLSLDDWERQTEGRPDHPDMPEDQRLPPRDALLAIAARSGNGARLRRLRDRLAEATALWTRLGASLDQRLGADSPSLGRVEEMLARLRHVADALPAEAEPVPVPVPVAPAASAAMPGGAQAPGASGAPVTSTEPTAATHANAAHAHAAIDRDTAFAAATEPPTLSALSALPATAELAEWSTGATNWPSRAAAYRSLEAIADYLAQVEPHSPTPYLIRRAVNWGRLPLPELMQEMLREEGDITRLFRLLGVQQQA